MNGIIAQSAVERIKDFINAASAPHWFLILSVAGLAIFLAGYRFFTKPAAALALLGAATLAFVLSAFDSDFRSIITKADNVPITMMMVLVGFFVWLALRQAAINDDNAVKGRPLIEAGSDDKVLVWPDLVYSEFICLILCSAALFVWTIVVRAPLEQPADPNVAPNPAKAPWYFLGLQELLVYFDPWIAGVLLPGLIIVGLMAIPYIDRNPRGNGYYTFKERPFAITTFMFGFVILWVVLIFFGTFLRGPNWNFFGPYEYWDPHQPVALVNLEPRDLFWVKIGGRGVWSEDVGPIPAFVIRELPGLILVALYFILGPLILKKLFFRRMYEQIGFARYTVLSLLLLCMLAVPIKMVLRWMFNLHYVVGMMEVFFNI